MDKSNLNLEMIKWTWILHVFIKVYVYKEDNDLIIGAGNVGMETSIYLYIFVEMNKVIDIIIK